MLTSVVTGLVAGGTYGLLALGLVLVYKGSRVLNFAQGEIGTGALFVAWIVVERLHQPWIVGAVVAIAAAVGLGLAFERLVVRTMGDAPRLSVAVATIGLLTILFLAEGMVFGPAGRILPAPIPGLGVRVFDFYVGPSVMVALGVIALLALGLAAFLRFTDFGLGVLAAAQDPTAARLCGVPLGAVSAFTWGFAAAIAALAALLIEPTIGVFAPGYATELFVGGLAAALLGGLTSLPGAFVGGIAVGLIEKVSLYLVTSTAWARDVGTNTLPGVKYVTVFLIILVVLLVRPQGLLGGPRARVA